MIKVRVWVGNNDYAFADEYTLKEFQEKVNDSNEFDLSNIKIEFYVE